MFRFALVLVLFASSCGSENQSVRREDANLESRKAAPQAAFCELDLSEWAAESHSPFVHSDVATQALRPAVLTLQKRVCACLLFWSGRPTTLKFLLEGQPNQGRTTVRLMTAPDEGATFIGCVGSFDAKFPAFDFRGDLITCSPQPCEPTAKPASFVYPLKVTLE